MLDDGRPALAGMDLRYVLTIVLLDAGRPLTTAELVDAVRSAGLDIAGRASKTVSDALRWEIRRGRVVRLGRCLYGRGSMPRSTQWWIRQRVTELLPRDEFEVAW